ncbi:UBC6, partial [Symbiodinium microadriaticum]
DLSSCLDETAAVKIAAAQRLQQELRSRTSSESQLSPQEVQELKRLGIRQCPRCHVLIQKQADGLLTGCDKMTCRCGSMFCFSCGMEARPGGVARCRCVGAHHGYIPHSAVLDNYKSWAGPAAVDMDLVKRPRGAPSKSAVQRLRRELEVVTKDPPPFIRVSCPDSAISKWHFVIEGPPDTSYAGGVYWGQIEMLKEYPFEPPLVRFRTPNGRFQVDTWLCRTQLDYHPEGWQPPWTIGSLLVALLALLCSDAFTVGLVQPPATDSEKRRLASESLQWNRGVAAFLTAFPNYRGKETLRG